MLYHQYHIPFNSLFSVLIPSVSEQDCFENNFIVHKK